MSAADSADSGLDWVAILGIVSSVSSIVLAVLAIWLSLVFYRLSDRSLKDLEAATSRVGETVDKLEALYSRLYTDLFSLTNDTIKDLRRSVFGDWDRQKDPGDAVEAVHRQLDEAKSQVLDELGGSVDTLGSAGINGTDVERYLELVVERSLERGASLANSARSKDIQDRVLEAIGVLTDSKGAAVADEVLLLCSDQFSGVEIRQAISSLVAGGRVSISSAALSSGSILRVLPSGGQSSSLTSHDA